MDRWLPLELNPGALPLGAEVGPWRVIGWRGQGSYGTLYRVERIGAESQGHCALKIAHHPGDERFEREAQLLSRLQHPNVPRLHGHGHWRHPHGAFPFLVMEWVEGISLYPWATQHAPTSRRVLEVLAQVARALAATHAAGAVHRDVKGDNMLVRLEDGRPFLLDFGAGKYAGAPSLTPQVLPVTTAEYRDPEAWAFLHRFAQHPEARYEASAGDDLFALGMTGYRLVTGQYPPLADARMKGSELWRPGGPGPRPPRALNPRVSQGLERLLLRLLAVEPQQRFAGQALWAAQALEQAARDEGAEADRALYDKKAAVSASWVPRGAPAPEPVPPEFSTPEPPAQPEPVAARPSFEKPPTEARAGKARWLALAAAGMLLVCARWLAWEGAAPDRAQVQEQEARVDPSRDGGAAGLGDAPRTAPAVGSMAADKPRSLARQMPKAPLPGQRTPPCDQQGEVEVHGGCWYELARPSPPCRDATYEWKGGCYVPSTSTTRPPTSDAP